MGVDGLGKAGDHLAWASHCPQVEGADHNPQGPEEGGNPEGEGPAHRHLPWPLVGGIPLGEVPHIYCLVEGPCNQAQGPCPLCYRPGSPWGVPGTPYLEAPDPNLYSVYPCVHRLGA
jgi:hypothetical protein